VSDDRLLEARGLVYAYPGRDGRGARRAVDGVDVDIHRGEVVALVGESGSGKSTLARLLVRLLEPDAGSLSFDGVSLTHLSRHRLRALRRRFQIVFQDPKSALAPRQKVGALLDEPLQIHGLGSAQERRRRVLEVLEDVGLSPDMLERHPHALSGGQRQRVNIARALVLEPELVVLDEPLTALDVSVQAQVLNLLLDLQERKRLAYLLIAHDLDVVAHLADRVLVMFGGRVVEEGPTRAVFEAPAHPYTRALLASRPHPRSAKEASPALARDGAEALPGEGCRFAARCPLVEARCATASPAARSVGTHHRAACYLVEERSATPEG